MAERYSRIFELRDELDAVLSRVKALEEVLDVAQTASLELCHVIEQLPASTQQTEVSIKASKLHHDICAR